MAKNEGSQPPSTPVTAGLNESRWKETLKKTRKARSEFASRPWWICQNKFQSGFTELAVLKLLVNLCCPHWHTRTSDRMTCWWYKILQKNALLHWDQKHKEANHTSDVWLVVDWDLVQNTKEAFPKLSGLLFVLFKTLSLVDCLTRRLTAKHPAWLAATALTSCQVDPPVNRRLWICIIQRWQLVSTLRSLSSSPAAAPQQRQQQQQQLCSLPPCCLAASPDTLSELVKWLERLLVTFLRVTLASCRELCLKFLSSNSFY